MIFLYKIMSGLKLLFFRIKMMLKIIYKIKFNFKNSKTAIANGSGADNKLFPFSLPSKNHI